MLKTFFLLQIRKNIGEFLRLFFILFLSIFGFIFSDSVINNAYDIIKGETRELLGGDIVIESSVPFDGEFQRKISSYQNKYQIDVSRKVTMDSTVLLPSGKSFFSKIEFIDPNYPLSGKFDIKEINASGSILISDAILGYMSGSSSLNIGGKSYTIKGYVLNPPGIGISFFTEGRTLWLPYEEVENSPLIGLGSRVEYHTILSSNNQDFFKTFEREKGTFSSYQVRDYTSSIERVSDSLVEFSFIIQLFLLFAFTISIISIYISLESYFFLERKNFSLFMILGMKRKFLFFYFISFLFCIYHISFLFACLVNYGFLSALDIFFSYFSFKIFQSSLFLGYVIGIGILFLGVCSSLFSFFSLRILDAFKGGKVRLSLKSIVIQGSIIFLGALIFLFFTLGFNTFYIFVLVAILFLVSLIAFLFSWIYKYISNHSQSLRKKYFLIFDVLRFTVRPQNMTLIVTLPLFITFSFLLTFSSFSLTFLDKASSLSQESNTFILNIPNKQALVDIIRILPENQQSYDIILGRLKRINQQSISDFLGVTTVPREFSREFNLTTSELTGTPVLAGKVSIEPGEVSIDQSFARRLGVGIGDKIVFLVSGKEKEFIIVNERQSLRDGFNPFFYFQFHPQDFIGLGRTYFVSFERGSISIQDLKSKILELSLPQVNIVDLSAIAQKVQSILFTIIQFTAFILLYIVIYNLIILSVSINFLTLLRKRVSFLYSLLGASKQMVRYHVFFEFMYLIFVSGILSLVVSFIGYSLLIYNSEFLDFSLSVVMKTFFLFLSFLFIITCILWIFQHKLKK